MWGIFKNLDDNLVFNFLIQVVLQEFGKDGNKERASPFVLSGDCNFLQYLLMFAFLHYKYFIQHLSEN